MAPNFLDLIDDGEYPYTCTGFNCSVDWVRLGKANQVLIKLCDLDHRCGHYKQQQVGEAIDAIREEKTEVQEKIQAIMDKTSDARHVVTNKIAYGVRVMLNHIRTKT